MYYFQHDPIRLQVSKELVGNKQPWPPSSQGFKAERGSDHWCTWHTNPWILTSILFLIVLKDRRAGRCGEFKSQPPLTQEWRKGLLGRATFKAVRYYALLSHNYSIRVPQCFCLLSNSSGWYGEGRSPGFSLALGLFQKAIFPAYVCWSDIQTEYLKLVSACGNFRTYNFLDIPPIEQWAQPLRVTRADMVFSCQPDRCPGNNTV